MSSSGKTSTDSKVQTLMDVTLTPLNDSNTDFDTNTEDIATVPPPGPEDTFVETLINNLRSFMLAGYDTMTSTMRE